MDPQPTLFSIIIPTYNRPERLQKCLQSIARLDYPRDCFEVIIVDDGSQVSLDDVIEPLRSSFTLNLIRQPNAGPASARNTGAAAAKGDYLAFTDDDCQPEPSWLEALTDAIATAPEALVGGHTVNALSDNVYSTASQLLIDYLYDYYNQTGENPSFFASNNFAVPRMLFQRLGGFDTNFPLAAGEDREFCDRWQQHNLPMHYAPKMQIYHAHRLNLQSFWRQHFNYGRGAFYFHKARQQRQREAMKVEPISFYLQLLTYPFSQCKGWYVISLSMLLFCSQVANVAGFLRGKYDYRSIAETTAATSS